MLDMYLFQSLHEVREQTEKWLKEYNEERPIVITDSSLRSFGLTKVLNCALRARRARFAICPQAVAFLCDRR